MPKLHRVGVRLVMTITGEIAGLLRHAQPRMRIMAYIHTAPQQLVHCPVQLLRFDYVLVVDISKWLKMYKNSQNDYKWPKMAQNSS